MTKGAMKIFKVLLTQTLKNETDPLKTVKIICPDSKTKG